MYSSYDFNENADIIVDQSRLLYPLHGNFDKPKPDKSKIFMPLEEIYQPWNQNNELLPLRKENVPYSFDFNRNTDVLKTDTPTTKSHCIHQDLSCVDHLSHTLNCPICKEYFDSRIRYLYIIIAILVLVILFLKFNK